MTVLLNRYATDIGISMTTTYPTAALCCIGVIFFCYPRNLQKVMLDHHFLTIGPLEVVLSQVLVGYLSP